MWSTTVFLLSTFFPFPASCTSDFHQTRPGYPRNYVSEDTVADSYDFVIAGGGLAGLVIASRLSEDSNTTVLVVEAGETGDAVAELSINPPSGTYYNSLIGTSYDWQHLTVPQTNADGRVIPWPRGKVLGGSSTVNGMYYIRPSKVEVDAWKNMIQSEDGSEAWGWDNFFTAMKKSETFTPPSDDIRTSGNIIFKDTSYGSKGPIHISYPGFLFALVGNWIPSLEKLGISAAPDPNGGENYGAFVSSVSINPTNWTRSYSKSGYIDPLPPRSNLDILVSATVTKILFGDRSSSGSQVATGIEFASSVDTARKVVKVKKEVILSGGALGSPHILMLSGVGPKDVLNAAGVSVISELPGVGQHLQDHVSAPVVWKSLVETAGDLRATGSSFSKQAIAKSFINSATAYVNTSVLLNNSSILQSNIQAALTISARTLVPSRNQQVIEGYKAIYNTTQAFISGELGQIELLLSINTPGAIAIQAALQHPYSQGHVYINSSSAFDPLVIDPQYFSHLADIVLLREGIKLARKLGQAPPLNGALGDEMRPGPGVSTDEEIDVWLAKVASTEFHPTATCAMLPESQGGVVNAKLQVYGLANVRVADSSVFPITFSGHPGAATYGLAEAAADIIRAAYLGTNISANTSSTTSGGQPIQTAGERNQASTTLSSWAVWTAVVVMTYLVKDIMF